MRRIALLGSLLVLAMLLVAACGGDDDDDDDDDAGASGSTPTATATMADDNGGGDDDDDDGNGSGDDDDGGGGAAPSGGGDFGSYAADLCTAIDDFVQTLPGLMNQQQFAAGNFDSLAQPYSDLADDLERARPPDELAEYHAALVEVIRATADAFEEGGIEAFGRLDELSNFPEPSEDVLEAFSRQGGDIPACRNIGFADGS